MTSWPIKTTKYIHSLQKSTYCTATILETTTLSPLTLNVWDVIGAILYSISRHLSTHKSPVKNKAEIASVEKSASDLHLLYLQNGTWAHESIPQSLCTEVGTFNCIFECSQLTRIIMDFSVSGHLCHITVDQWKLYSFLGIYTNKNDYS